MRIVGCSRCGGDHEDAPDARPLIPYSRDTWTHYTICPTTHRIIFVRYTGGSDG